MRLDIMYAVRPRQIFSEYYTSSFSTVRHDKLRPLSSVLRSVTSCAPTLSVRLLRTVSAEGLSSCRLVTFFGCNVCEITGGLHIQRFRQRGHPSCPQRPLVSGTATFAAVRDAGVIRQTDMALCCCWCCYTYKRTVQPTDAAPSCETAHPVH
jgi:hypothetical protein